MPLYFNNGALLRGTGNTLASDQACCCEGGGGPPPEPCACLMNLRGMLATFQGKTFVLGEFDGTFELTDDYIDEWTSSPAENAYFFIYRRTLAFPAGTPGDYKSVVVRCTNPGEGEEVWLAEFESTCYEYDEFGVLTAQTTTFALGDFLCYAATIDCGDARDVGSPIPLGEPVSIDDYQTTTPPGVDACTPIRASISIEEACIT